jgi:RNA polymerase sigma-70 factor, ECF subfamily
VAQAVCLGETRRVIGAGADAEDAAQNALLRVWRRRESLTGVSEPLAWLRTVARNEALRVVRQSERHPHADGARMHAIREREPSEHGQPGSPDLLSALDCSDRALVDLRYEEDLSYAQIAERLAMPVGTVKVRMHRLHRRLRRDIEWERPC